MKPTLIYALWMLSLLTACSPAVTPTITPTNTPAPPPANTALPTPAGALSTPTQATALKVPVSVGATTSLSYIPLDIAKALKYFDAEGLSVDLQRKADASQASSALLAGTVTFAATALADAIKAQPQGKTLKLVVSFARLPGVVALVRADLANSIKMPSDFKGRKIGVAEIGGDTHVLATLMASRAGLKVDDYAVLPVGSSTMAGAFNRKEIDVGFIADPFATQLLKGGGTIVLADLRTQAGADQYVGGEFQSTGLLADALLIRNKPELVQKMVNALVKATTYMRAHSARELADLLPDDVTGRDKQAWIDAYMASVSIYPMDSKAGQAGVDNAVAAYRLFGTIRPDDKIDSNALYDNTFVDKAK